MDVRDAVRLAKKYVVEVFDDDDISNVGLEEVDFDHRSDVWKITVGFHRPTGLLDPVNVVVPGLSKGIPVRRVYKIVNIDDTSGRVLSLKHRILESTD